MTTAYKRLKIFLGELSRANALFKLTQSGHNFQILIWQKQSKEVLIILACSFAFVVLTTWGYCELFVPYFKLK